MPSRTPATPPGATAPRRKRGPQTAEGKVRSARNAVKHGLRARRFVLPPGEDAAAYAAFAAGIQSAYGPEDAAEAEIVDVLAASLWQAARAGRIEAELLAAIPPRHHGHGHGSDLIERAEHRAGLTTVLRYQAAAGNAARRALDLFLKHRKARRDGLILDPTLLEAMPAPLLPAPEIAATDGPDEVPAAEPAGLVLPAAGTPDPEAAAPVLPPDAPADLFRPGTPTRVQGFLLAQLAGCTPEEREHFYALRSIEAFEAWAAGQPAAEPCQADPEDLALARWITRHNPPWAHGPQPGETVPRPACLGPSPPVPANDPRPDPASEEPALRARLARLLDRTAAKDRSDLDLAHAICALSWPKYPAYAGRLDLMLLRRILQTVPIDSATLHWLDSHELARAAEQGERAKRAG